MLFSLLCVFCVYGGDMNIFSHPLPSPHSTPSRHLVCFICLEHVSRSIANGTKYNDSTSSS